MEALAITHSALTTACAIQDLLVRNVNSISMNVPLIPVKIEALATIQSALTTACALQDLLALTVNLISMNVLLIPV